MKVLKGKSVWQELVAAYTYHELKVAILLLIILNNTRRYFVLKFSEIASDHLL